MTFPTKSPRQLADEAAANPFARSASSFPPQWSGEPPAAEAAPAPFMDLDAKSGSASTETVPLFVLDGHTYSIPARPKAGVALKYLYALKRGVSPDAAAADMLETLLGEEAFAALATSDKVELEDFAKLMEIVKEKVLGPALAALGN